MPTAHMSTDGCEALSAFSSIPHRCKSGAKHSPRSGHDEKVATENGDFQFRPKSWTSGPFHSTARAGCLNPPRGYCDATFATRMVSISFKPEENGQRENRKLALHAQRKIKKSEICQKCQIPWGNGPRAPETAESASHPSMDR